MSELNSFVVRPLSAFKQVLVNGNEYLCRKIEKGEGAESKGALISKLSREEDFFNYLEMPAIQEAAYNWLLGQVEELVKEQIGQGKEVIYKESLSAENLNTYLQDKAEKESLAAGRISKEKITSWYREEVAPTLIKAFEAKLGAPIEASKAQKLIEMYDKVFSKFSARKAYLPKAAYGTCEKVLEIVKDSAIKKYCLTKLPEMQEPTFDDFGL